MNSVTFEIDSCQWLHEQTRMLESSMCSACKDLGRYGRKYYRDHEIPTTGVCHKLYPHLAPAPVADQENIGICNQDRNEEESEFQLGSSQLLCYSGLQLFKLYHYNIFFVNYFVSLRFLFISILPCHSNSKIHLSIFKLQEQPVRLALVV